MSTRIAEPAATAYVVLDSERVYTSPARMRDFWTARCLHPDHGPIMLNSGHHYDTEAGAIAKALEHDLAEHAAPALAPEVEGAEEPAPEDLCSNCDEPTDDGEGWDGLCGSCADAAEDEGEEAPELIATYTLTPARPHAGRFARQDVQNAAHVTVATLTYATAPDPHGISGNGGHLTPVYGLHLTEWHALVAHMGKARANGTVPAELESSSFEGTESMRAAILATAEEADNVCKCGETRHWHKAAGTPYGAACTVRSR